MTVRFDENTIFLVGACPAQDAESFAARLIRQRSSLVDARECVSLHSAVMQVFLAFKPRISKPPEDPLLAGMILQVTGGIEG